MNIGLKMTVTAGLMAGAFGMCTSASAMPALDGTIAHQADATTPKAEKVWCNIYGCHHHYYHNYYYHHYGYGYARPYYGGYYHPYGYGYGPHIGIGIGGIGIY